MQGWIKVYRKLIDNPIFLKPELLQLFLFCLLKANHEPGRVIFGGNEIIVNNGQFITGRFELATALRCNSNTVYKRLQTLRKMGVINTKSNNKNTLVTIVNWEAYQEVNNISNNKSNNKVTTKEQQSNTNKNDKNNKNERSNRSSSENKFSDDTFPYRLSKKMKEFILENNPKARVPDNLQKWSLEFDRMIRIDNREPKDIYEVVKYSQQDHFWMSNILSPASLRKQYDKLYLQMQIRPRSRDKPSQSNFEQRKYSDDEYENLYKNLKVGG